ncbi:penicillin-binding transpeptidase domain-containing protein [Allonocardiopsis opalescens]|uniref:MecA-like transpeptidase family protein n=1 Tax=Allonocardiopsis opalescens TaxID=1144618 RepID=A0A2T0Q4Q7_9ACTN|nr:penicillin-binding transpeptidase domain-containing protein [Allonocardiopsis opalescens]PRX98786.1 MecA-like transpeptidase family protein [Allonocardiopsis opalescens]
MSGAAFPPPPPAKSGGPAHAPPGRPRRRSTLIAVIAVATALVVALGAGAWWLLRTQGSPQQAAADFAAAWQAGDHAAMGALTAQGADLSGPYQALAEDLGVTATQVEVTSVAETGDQAATAAFTATLQLADAGAWTYEGSLPLTVAERRWTVDWSPAAVHPDLAEGQRFGLAAQWGERGAILAADGSRLDGSGASGSVQMLTGTLGEAEAGDLERLGPAYAEGDPAGVGGIQQAWEAHLAGTPTSTVQILDAQGEPVADVGTIEGEPGADVHTSLDPAVQEAAASAIVDQDTPTALVALRPSTGEILAAANVPGGFNRAISGQYPPGSTFKVVTATGLLAAGLSLDDTVQCPRNTEVGGQTFRNFEFGELGSTSFLRAFAESCNTTMVMQTQELLDPQALTDAAELYGFNSELAIGIPDESGSFPVPADQVQLSTASFGQGLVTASPLLMAGVAAAVADGQWRPPVLVTEPQVEQEASARPIEHAEQLRELMGAVVESGSAADAGLPSGTYGKTGTAEYGTAPEGGEPPTHGWFIGFRPDDDLAFAVIVEEGESGGSAAAPVAADFLGNL